MNTVKRWENWAAVALVCHLSVISQCVCVWALPGNGWLLANFHSSLTGCAPLYTLHLKVADSPTRTVVLWGSMAMIGLWRPAAENISVRAAEWFIFLIIHFQNLMLLSRLIIQRVSSDKLLFNVSMDWLLATGGEMRHTAKVQEERTRMRSWDRSRERKSFTAHGGLHWRAELESVHKVIQS